MIEVRDTLFCFPRGDDRRLWFVTEIRFASARAIHLYLNLPQSMMQRARGVENFAENVLLRSRLCFFGRRGIL